MTICIYPTPLPCTICEIRSTFDQSKTGLNSKSSFSYYLLIARERRDGFIPFPRHKGKCEQLCPEFELGLSVLFPKTIIIMAHAYFDSRSANMHPNCKTLIKF